jgi:hypothetical protein
VQKESSDNIWNSFILEWSKQVIIVLELVSQIHDVVLMNVYLDLVSPGGSGFWNEGYVSQGREMGRSVYEQPRNKVDGSCHSKEGSK